MAEKIAFVSWDYFRLMCPFHKEEIVLALVNGRPVYKCETEGCTTQISAELYEKILDDIVSFQNAGELPVGYKWRRKSNSRIVEFTVIACTSGMRPEISVHVL